jgi:hypothetical protein
MAVQQIRRHSSLVQDLLTSGRQAFRANMRKAPCN